MSKQEMISALKDVIKYFTLFFAPNFSPYFPPLKPRRVLWSGASYSPKNTVVTIVIGLKQKFLWSFQMLESNQY